MRSPIAPRTLRISLALAIAVASLASLVSVRPAQAATFWVDDGDVAQLIAAINNANGNPGPDTIELAAGSTYTLTAVEISNMTGSGGLPSINSEITIHGNGATITRSSADGTPDFRIVTVSDSGNLTLDGVTISNGRTWLGGGIFVAGGVLRLTHSAVINNDAQPIGGDGGGINGNFGSTLFLTNSTISGNTAMGWGGGLVFLGTSTVINSTISGNTGRFGGGVNIYSSSQTTFTNTIIAGNTATDIDDDITGSATGTHNLIGDGTGMSGLTDGVDGNQVGTTADPIDPLLDTLADNGGSTQTMALLPGSPAIDAGTSAGQTPSTDQRGVSRPQGTANDIGAYELDPSVTYADLCMLTQQRVHHPILARAACATLLLAERADQAGNVRVEQMALNMYRMQIRILMAFRAISATDGQYLIDLSYEID